MGLETALILGFAAFQADQQIRAGEAEARATVETAELENIERRKRTQALAARQKVSFLQSGLALEGTPLTAISQTFQTGIEDIDLASRNAERTAKNIQRNARSQAIGTLVQAGIGASVVGSGAFSGSGTFGAQGQVSRAIEFGTTQAQGPIQGFGGFDIGGGLRRGGA